MLGKTGTPVLRCPWICESRRTWSRRINSLSRTVQRYGNCATAHAQWLSSRYLPFPPFLCACVCVYFLLCQPWLARWCACNSPIKRAIKYLQVSGNLKPMLPQNKKELQTDTCAHRVLLLSKIKLVLYFQLILDRAKCICRSTHSASVWLPQHTETNSVHCSVRTYRWKLTHAENPRPQQFSYSETAFSLQMHDIWITRTFPIFVLP